MKSLVFALALSVFCGLILFSDSSAQPTIAVMDFVAKGVSEMEASALTDRLRTEMVQTGKYKVVEREMMNVILAEQGFQMSGCVTDKCIVAVGQVLGAAQMVAGSISKVGETYSVSARAVDVETGEITRTATYDHAGAIDELLKTGMAYVASVLSSRSEEKPQFPKEKIIEESSDKQSGQILGISGTQKSAIGLSLTTFGSREYGIAIMAVEYSKGITPSIFFDIECGFARWNSAKSYNEYSPEQLTAEIRVAEISYISIVHLNYWIKKNGGKGIYAFAGIGGLKTKFEHFASGRDFFVDKPLSAFLPLFSGGIGINVIARRHFIFGFSLGYIFSPAKVFALDKEWGAYQAYGSSRPNPSMSPAGALISLKFNWLP